MENLKIKAKEVLESYPDIDRFYEVDVVNAMCDLSLNTSLKFANWLVQNNWYKDITTSSEFCWYSNKTREYTNTLEQVFYKFLKDN